jgi:outer membrane receptor protein involved in Fe transport
MENGDNYTNDYTLAYKKTFQNKGQEFTLDAVFSQSPDDEESDTYRDYTDGTLVAPDDSRDQTMTESSRDNFNIQANYVHPFSKDLRLEGGYQGIIRSTDDDYQYFTYDPDLAVFNIDTALSNHFVYDENIHAVYGIVGHTLGKFSYQAGLRFEMASTKADQRTMEEVYTKSYNSLYPTLHLNYKLPLEQEVQLSYSRRVNRPNMWSLNPFVDYSVPGMIRYGNPYLTPEYINATELGYSKYWKKSTLNGSVFYRYIDDVIKRYMFLDSNGILNYTSKNLTSGTSYGLELVFDTEIFKWWKLSVNGSYFKNEVKGAENGTDLSNSNYSWNGRLNSNMVLPKKIMFQFTANYRGPQLNLQGTMSANFTCDLALRKDFYKDKISLSFRLSDIFKTSKFEVENSGEGFSADMVRYRESRVAYLGLTVKFGKEQKTMKRSKKSENGGEGGGEEF